VTTLWLLRAFTCIWRTRQTPAERPRHGILRRLETMANLRPTIAFYCPLSKAYWLYTSVGSWLQSRCQAVSSDSTDWTNCRNVVYGCAVSGIMLEYLEVRVLLHPVMPHPRALKCWFQSLLWSEPVTAVEHLESVNTTVTAREAIGKAWCHTKQQAGFARVISFWCVSLQPTTQPLQTSDHDFGSWSCEYSID
jgi:hypothetical protein